MNLKFIHFGNNKLHFGKTPSVPKDLSFFFFFFDRQIFSAAGLNHRYAFLSVQVQYDAYIYLR